MTPPRKNPTGLGLRFVEWCETQGFELTTVQQYRSVVRRFQEWCGDRPLDTLKLGDLEDFVADTYGHLSYSSKKSGVVAMRSYFHWLLRRGEISSDPSTALSFPKKPRRRPTYYKPEQAAALLQAFDDPKHKLLATLLLRHGQRITPTSRLQWRMVDFDQAKVRYESIKRGRPMTLPLDKPTATSLKAWKAVSPHTDDDDYVFPGRWKGECMSLDLFRDRLREACRKAGVPYRGAHEFRRTLATTLLQMGEPLHRVSREILDHASVATTAEHYAGAEEMDVAAALRQLPY